mmetsp:Transcript_4782/g.12146  ORF Transcript_4782/g.12146 Transcript_4782/m.12146 type:complete len:533 (-) Transcript_4782:84-1682(-)
MNSISAPRWTDEDELNESMSLSPVEREQVYSDLFGCCDGSGPQHPRRPIRQLASSTSSSTSNSDRRRNILLKKRSSSGESSSHSSRGGGGGSRLSLASSSSSAAAKAPSTSSASVSFNSDDDEVVVRAAAIHNNSGSSHVLQQATPQNNESLKQEERLDISQAIEAAAMLRMVEAIDGMKPNSGSGGATSKKPNNAAYMEAMRYNPKLVNFDTETKLPVFLWRENGSPEAAAARVCSYWNLRKKLFEDSSNGRSIYTRKNTSTTATTTNTSSSSSGQFCRPVTLRDGIMKEEDIRFLKSGALQFLPNDSQGRTVLYFDKEAYKHPKEYSRVCLNRCIFYMLHRAMTKNIVDDATSGEEDADDGMNNVRMMAQHHRQQNDVVLVCNFKNYDASHFDRKCFKTLMEMINFCLPIRIVAQHYCYGSKRSAFQLVLPTLKSLMGPTLRQRLCTHTGTPAVIASSLAEFGVIHVPAVLGGQFVPIPCSEWVEQSQKKELHRQMLRSSSTASDTASSSPSKSSTKTPSKLKSTWNRAA